MKICALLFAFLILLGSQSYGATNSSSLSNLIQAKAVLLVDASTGNVLYSKNPETPYPPASTVKLLTALLVYERMGLDGTYRVTLADTRAEPSHVPLRAGESVRIRDMVKAVLIGSRNDAALALANYTGGTLPGFMELMNRRAAELGCTQTVFKNPNGLPAEGQLSTAKDLMRIFDKVLSIPELRTICRTKAVTIQTRTGNHYIKNHNLLLGKYPGMGPAKTGWTIKSRHTYAAAAIRNGRELRLTLLNSPNKWSDARLLFDYGFRELGVQLVSNAKPTSPQKQ